MATRREYLVIKRDAGTDPDIVKAPAGGTLNGVTDGVIRLKVQGESVLVQNISANDWWVTADTRDKTPVGTIVAFAGDDTPPGYVWCNGASLSRTDARYIELFAKLSTASGQTVSPRWGYADATTFRVPDLRGVFLRGVDSGRGQDPDVNSRTAAYPNGSTGGVVGSYQDSDTKAHQHNVSLSGNTGDVGGHNHGSNANPGERGLIRRSATSDGNTTTDGADQGGKGNEPDVVNAPSAIPFDGGHNHSISLSGVSSATGGNESRPKNVYVHYFIKY
jgi:microcystin-dependent protein